MSEKQLKTKKSSGVGTTILNFLQELGKALQFPIAILPFAAILNRFGGLGVQFTTDANDAITNQVGYWISFIIQKPGGIIFDNLALFFAIGVAFGMAKDKRGEVALVGAAIYLILVAFTSEHGLPEMIYKNVLTFKDKDGKLFSQLFYIAERADDGKTITGGAYVLGIGALGGIVSGITAAKLYERFKEIKLPAALSFFGGRRFVPMLGLIASVPLGLLFAIIWPWFQFGLVKMGSAVANPNNMAVAVPGTMIYGFFNRLLIPFGLHQILNTLFWFQLPIDGDKISQWTGVAEAAKDPFTAGDINAFMAGRANAGLFQSGFFPVMMGGVPAIALAMIFTAEKSRRREVAGFLGGVAVVSFVSGITEPIEFSFVFIAPLLLVLHGLLAAIFVGLTTAMHIQVGFGFSAGLIDYIVSLGQSWGFAKHLSETNSTWGFFANPLWILPLTVVAGAAWYFVFFFAIKGLNLPTPGREELVEGKTPTPTAKPEKGAKKAKGGDKYQAMADAAIAAIGLDNFVSVDNCATRLRLIVKDNTKIDEAKIKASGAFGVKKLGSEGVQIVIGPDVEHVANIVKQVTGK